eukprot:759668-Hanusia_phi.AAC.3
MRVRVSRCSSWQVLGVSDRSHPKSSYRSTVKDSIWEKRRRGREKTSKTMGARGCAVSFSPPLQFLCIKIDVRAGEQEKHGHEG